MACSLLFITQLALVATVVVFDIQQNSVTVMQSTKDPCCCEDDESSKLQKQNVQEHEFALLLAHKELVKERKLQEQVEERKLPRRGLGGAAARVHVISDSDDDVCITRLLAATGSRHTTQPAHAGVGSHRQHAH